MKIMGQGEITEYVKLLTPGTKVDILGHSKLFDEYLVRAKGTQCAYWYPSTAVRVMEMEDEDETK
mgnify:CR=1 FL=1